MLYVIDNNKMGFETFSWFVETNVSQETLDKILALLEQPHSILFSTDNVKWIEGTSSTLEEYVSDFEYSGKEIELSQFEDINKDARISLLKNAIDRMREEIDALKESLIEYDTESQSQIEEQIQKALEVVESYETTLQLM